MATQIAGIPMPSPTSMPSFPSFEIPHVPLLLVVLVPSLAPLGVGLFSLSPVVAVVEGPDVVGVVTVIIVVDDVGCSKQTSASMSIIFWNEFTYSRLRSLTIQSPELPRIIACVHPCLFGITKNIRRGEIERDLSDTISTRACSECL